MQRYWNALQAVIITFGIGIATLSAARAQRVDTDATAKKLSTVIHLPAATITLDVLALEITKQSGVSIHPEPYLLAHKIILKSNGLSAVTLLNTVAEIYGWQWHESNVGVIVVERPTARLPASLPEVEAGIRKSLSPQLLRYMGCTDGASLPESTGSQFELRFPRVEYLTDARTAHIWPTFPDALRRLDKLPVARLPATDREKILESLVGQAFRDSYKCLNNLSAQMVPRYISDPLSATASYQYSSDGRLSSLLLATRSTDPTGTKHYLGGVGCSFDSLHHDITAKALREEADAMGR